MKLSSLTSTRDRSSNTDTSEVSNTSTAFASSSLELTQDGIATSHNDSQRRDSSTQVSAERLSVLQVCGLDGEDEMNHTKAREKAIKEAAKRPQPPSKQGETKESATKGVEKASNASAHKGHGVAERLSVLQACGLNMEDEMNQAKAGEMEAKKAVVESQAIDTLQQSSSKQRDSDGAFCQGTIEEKNLDETNQKKMKKGAKIEVRSIACHGPKKQDGSTTVALDHAKLNEQVREEEDPAQDEKNAPPRFQRDSEYHRGSLVGAVAVRGMDASLLDNHDISESWTTETPRRKSASSIGTSALLTADLVDDEIMQFALEVGMCATQDKKPMPRSRDKAQCLVGMGFCFAAMLALVLTLSLTLGRDERTASVTQSPIQSPTALVTEQPLSIEERILSLLPSYTRTQIQRVSSAQHDSFEWLVQDPNIKTYSDHRIVQRFALGTYYLSTGGRLGGGGSWVDDENWLSDEHECEWFHHNTSGIYSVPETRTGLMYNETGEVCDGEGNYLHLWYWTNGLRGRLPEELFLLTKLKSISLDRNELEGTLSTRISKLQGLEAISLYTNEMTGTIASQLGELDHLRFFWFMRNQLTGTIPSELGLISSLEHLIADSQGLTWTIPSEIGHLNNLIWFWLSSNKLSGSLPTEIGNLPAVDSLWLWDNQITGPLPTELGRMQALDSVAMDYNKFDGTLPSEVGLLTKLTTFHVGSPFITGSIPTEIGMLDQMQSIVLAETSLTGQVPTEIGLFTNMWRFWVYGSFVSGSIPSEFGLASGMWSLALEQSELTGQIPTEIFSLTDLGQLNLKYNHLTGSIPTEVGLLPGMHGYIWLQTNDLSGTLPSQLGQLSIISELRLNDNSFTSTVPTELSNLHALTILSISNNTLTGAIPPGICEIDTLWDEAAEGIRIDCDLMYCTCNACTCEG